MSDHDDAAEFGSVEYAPKSKSVLERALEYELNRAPTATPEEAPGPAPGAPTQWAIYGPGYKPTTNTIRSIPPGCYDIALDQYGPFFVPTLPPTGLLLELPEMRSEHVISLVESFWNSEKDYKEGNEFIHGGAAYKAGILLFGPPGSGKSCTIKLVARNLVSRGGTVFYADVGPSEVTAALQDFARVEKNRKCIVILEDFDSLLERYGTSGYLQMLDSAKAIDNVLFLATTNYPERLEPRVYCRPGRFSHVVKIGNPTAKAREAFLKAVLKSHRDVAEIVELTEGFSIDHLSYLISAVYREKKDLCAEVARLRTMFKVPKADDSGPMGLS